MTIDKRMNAEQIKRLLPHRYPFLLLDRVLEHEPGVSLAAVKNVTINEPFFQGHFPQKPVMPGVLVIEALAQASAVLGLLSAPGTQRQDRLYYLAGVDKARFRKTVEPGDQLVLETRLLTMRKTTQRFAGVARVGEAKVAEAELLTIIADVET